jgi:hypothetical protein
MTQSNKSIIRGLFFGFVLHASADVEIRAETKDHPGPYREWSQEFLQFEPENLHGMTAEKLAKMSLDDPLLRYAYIQVFLQNAGGLANLEGEHLLILSDMRRRGDAITPLLLELARQNQETMFEDALLNSIAEVGNIDLEPYLEYARNVLQERTQTMNATLAEYASLLLANHGTKQDLAILELVIAERSYTARGVTQSLNVFKRRLERLERAKQATRPLLRGEPSTSEAATGNIAENATKESVANRDGHISTKSWMIWALFGMIIAAILIWRWKSQSTSLKPPSGPI